VRRGGEATGERGVRPRASAAEGGRKAWLRGGEGAEGVFAEAVVVAPRWWAGGQPPPKIKMQNYRPVGFLETKMGLEVTGSKRLPLLEFLGGGFWISGHKQSRGLGLKARALQ
jgi:hypothetical protein